MTVNEKKIVDALRARAEYGAERGWNCLSEEKIASYADQRISDAQRQSIESHLANCDYCLAQLAFLARTAQSQLPDEVPPYLIFRGLEAARSKASRHVVFGWRWKTAISVAAAVGCVLVVSVITLHEPAPQIPAVKLPLSTEAPARTNSAPDLQPSAPTVRRMAKPALLPTVQFPQPGTAVPRKSLELRWGDVPGARYYDVAVANADGDLVWSTQTDKNSVKVPSGLSLTAEARYFVWVQAHFSQGKSVRSETVAFTISGQR